MMAGVLLGLLVSCACWAVGRDKPGHKETLLGESPGATPTETGTSPASRKRWDPPLGLGLVGVCLGWPAAVSVGLLAAAAHLLGALSLGVTSRRRPAPWLAYVGLAALLQICLWRGLDSLAFWPGGYMGLPALAASVTMTLVLTWQASVLERLVSTP